MADPPKPLSPKELADLIEELDQVLAEASNLRRQVTRQLEEHHQRQQQKLTAATRRAAARPR
ncbi:MAG TPA: hypothetical protein VFV95_02795 [Vicinamibacterales bacterium]|nr:hypothetical protein [Vicinamibacterales bacterium]